MNFLKRTRLQLHEPAESSDSQPFHVAEAFTGTSGKYVKVEDTVRAFKEICEGKHDEVPEQAFYMVGGIEEVLAKAEKMAAVE